MSPSLNDIASQIRSALAVTDPDLDTSTGTTTRKIIDAVAESIAESYLDQHMLAYTYDVDSKTEGDLDTFCQTVGGIARLAAKRATGTVTFTRSGSATSTVMIAIGTQVNSNTTPSMPVQTIAGAVMLPGQLNVTVGVQAVDAGPGGNLAANSLTVLASSVEGVATVTNLQPLTGGMAQETDDELRTRWKKTVFRSMAGTESMYLGLALDVPQVTAAQVLGASKRRREQVQVSGGKARTVVDDAAYVFPTGVFVGPNIDAGALLIQGVDYTWDTTVSPPQVTMLTDSYDTGAKDNTGAAIRAGVEGALLDVEFEYTPACSRNDPLGTRFGGVSLMSRVDVYCAGTDPVAAQQSVVFRDTNRFNDDPQAPFSTTKFIRPNGSPPVANNVFLPLSLGPIIAVPDILTIGGKTYGRMGTSATVDFPNAYAVVHDNSPFGYTATSTFGLEWSAGALPASGTVFTIGANSGYLYNRVPRTVQDSIDRWRLVGVDAKAHAAKQVLLRFNLAVMYDRGVAQSSVNEAIDTAISDYLGRVGLGGVVQISDLEQVAHNVPGVDNVRFLNWLDYPDWDYAKVNTFAVGVQRVVDGAVVQSYVSGSGRARDITFADNEVPVMESVYKAAKAQNTFRFA